MLRSFGIRAKILAVLALPVLVLSLAAGVIATSAIGDSRRATQVEELTRQAAGLTDLLRGLQAERALTVAVLSGDDASQPALDEVRSQVSAGLDGVRGEFASIDLSLLEESAQAGALASTQAHDLIPELRRQVDGGVLTPATALTRYSEIIAADISLPSAIADGLDDRQLAQNLRAYTATEQLAEAIASERDLTTPAVAAGVFTPEQLKVSQDAAQRTNLVRENSTRVTEPAGIRTPATGYTFELARQRTVDDVDGVLEAVTVDYWRTAADDDIAALGHGLDTVINSAQDRSSALAGDAQQYALQVIVGAFLAVAVPVVLALLLARRITRPLRRLTEAAGQIRENLPKMVERMATPGEGPGMTVPEIPVESNDEVGRLATAFNDVNSTTVQVAKEQAALRGSIAAMFVNVARRDQVLLSRQLSFLDQLERTEENPDTLDNLFKLDHLATRMRRNAESLLVLAGIDTGRRLRRPMPLSDVVRTASSEIEHYERVDLAQHVDPPMVGHTALLTAHLMAELLENATSFSDPGTRVVVATDAGPEGIVVTITDDGLGMSADELEEANNRIQNPPVSEVVGAQRLGFYVVGRLTKRLEADVALSAGDGRGTVVTIGLPPALFVPGTVVTDDSKAPAEEVGSTPDGIDEASTQPSTPGHVAPTGADTLGASADALNGAAAAAQSLTPIIIPAGTETELPQRGGAKEAGSEGSEGLPKLPTRTPAPAAENGAPTLPTLPTAPTLPQRGAAGTDTGLPTRTPSAPLPVEPPPAVPAQRSETPAPASRSGLFTGFRARRAEAVGRVAEETPAETPDAPAPVDKEPVVPVVEVPVAPDVAQLDDEPEPAVSLEIVDEVADAETEPVASSELELQFPEHEVAVQDAPAPAEEDTPLYAATVAAAAPAPEAPTPVAGSSPLAGRRPADADVTTHRRSAANELTALASRPAAAPVAPEAPAAPAPVFSSASALDILPGAHRGRSGSRGLKLPRRGREGDIPAARQHTTAPVPVPVTHAPPPASAVPTPADADQLVPVAAALADGAVAFVPTTAPPQSGDSLRQRSALASEALSELSRLSSYRPDATVSTTGGAAPALIRRTRGATAAAEVAAPQQAVSSRPGRSAAEVRSMLSGFQAGVARGRNEPAHSTQDVSE